MEAIKQVQDDEPAIRNDVPVAICLLKTVALHSQSIKEKHDENGNSLTNITFLHALNMKAVGFACLHPTLFRDSLTLRHTANLLEKYENVFAAQFAWKCLRSMTEFHKSQKQRLKR